jgi:hypothetical protein
MSESSEYHAAMGEFAGHMLCTAIASLIDATIYKPRSLS